MKTRVIVLSVFAIAFVVGVIAWRALFSHEPTYKNKRLSAWLRDMEQWDGDTNRPAFVAFREMGTNAIPRLLRMIQSGGSPIQEAIYKFNLKQSFVRLPYHEQSMAACWALYAMGQEARPALPVLTNLLFQTNTNCLIISATVLAGIGSEALPSLLAALTNQNDRIRRSAALGLGSEREGFRLVVPALIERLTDKSRSVHLNAVVALGELHAEPMLSVPALTNDFRGNDTVLKRQILISLSSFETNAVQALPLVRAALNDSDEDVRASAQSALSRIAP